MSNIESIRKQFDLLAEAAADIAEFAERWKYLKAHQSNAVQYKKRDGTTGWKVRVGTTAKAPAKAKPAPKTKAPAKSAVKKPASKPSGLTIEELRKRLGWDLPSPEPKSSGLTPVRSGERENFKHANSGKIGQLPGKPDEKLSNLDKKLEEETPIWQTAYPRRDRGQIGEISGLQASRTSQRQLGKLNKEADKRMGSVTEGLSAYSKGVIAAHERGEVDENTPNIHPDARMVIRDYKKRSQDQKQKLDASNLSKWNNLEAKDLKVGMQVYFGMGNEPFTVSKINKVSITLRRSDGRTFKVKNNELTRMAWKDRQITQEALVNGNQIPQDILQKYPDLAPPNESLVGGKADNIPDAAFDQAELAKGAAIEQEEHGVDPQEAKEIAKDHLVENPEEYKGEEPKAKEPWEMTKSEYDKKNKFPQAIWDDIKANAKYINKTGNSLVTVSPSPKDKTKTRITRWDHQGAVGHTDIDHDDVDRFLDEHTDNRGSKIIKVEGGLGGSKPSKNYAGVGFKPHVTGAKGVNSFIGPNDQHSIDWMLNRLSSGGYKTSIHDLEEDIKNESGTKTHDGETPIPSHEYVVANALSQGKPVPPEVLADYPDLASKYAKQDDAPKEGDRNADGLVFRDGRWHRDEEAKGPWHGNREHVFQAMRDLDAKNQREWDNARKLGPRGGTLPLGSADFDHTLSATIGDEYLRTIRKGGTPEEAWEAAKTAGAESIKKWNDTGHKSRVSVNSPEELKRWTGAGEQIADSIHRSFVDATQEQANSSAGAEPKSEDESTRDASPESNLGRTGGSIPPTGANQPIYDYEREKANLLDREFLEKRKGSHRSESDYLENEIQSLAKEREEVIQKTRKLKSDSTNRKVLESKKNGIDEQIQKLKSELETKNKSLRIDSISIAMHDADPIQMDALKVQEKGVYGDNRNESNSFFKKYSDYFTKDLEAMGMPTDEAKHQSGTIALRMLSSSSMKHALNYKQSLNLAVKKYQEDQDFEKIKNDFKAKYPNAATYKQHGLIRQAIDEPERRDELLSKADELFKKEHDAVTENRKKEEAEAEQERIANTFKSSLADSPVKNVTPAKLISMVKKQMTGKYSSPEIAFRTAKETGWITNGKFIVKGTPKDMKLIENQPVGDSKALLNNQAVFDRAKPANPAKVVSGLQSGDSSTVLIKADDGTEARADPQYLDVIRSRYPNARMFLNGSHKHNPGNTMIVFQDGGETVGVAMPIVNNDGKAFHKPGTHEII